MIKITRVTGVIRDVKIVRVIRAPGSSGMDRQLGTNLARWALQRGRWLMAAWREIW